MSTAPLLVIWDLPAFHLSCTVKKLYCFRLHCWKAVSYTAEKFHPKDLHLLVPWDQVDEHYLGYQSESCYC